MARDRRERRDLSLGDGEALWGQREGVRVSVGVAVQVRVGVSVWVGHMRGARLQWVRHRRQRPVVRVW